MHGEPSKASGAFVGMKVVDAQSEGTQVSAAVLIAQHITVQMLLLLLISCLIVGGLLTRIAILLRATLQRLPDDSVKTMIVLGSGSHLVCRCFICDLQRRNDNAAHLVHN